MDVIYAFGPKFAAAMIAGIIAYYLFALSPILWPAFRAFRRGNRLPRPLLFISTVATLTYGLLFLLFWVVSLPLERYSIYIWPTVQDLKHSYGSWAVAAQAFVAKWFWLTIPLVLVLLAGIVTRMLGVRWARIASALAR